eukprot:CAMPEP_0185542972 /NCGR_PEP_ID=MMETSP1381-20130426/2977_1 /TAXON_ID=298111 /ORGANISM="Pavlova sp., Strain CCMP459" /LENGTH=139 /DNA_ID=CAMNT_0028155029 /DNA_START=12 /DNA_END=431 /DNA_ORIENTATION=+
MMLGGAGLHTARRLAAPHLVLWPSPALVHLPIAAALSSKASAVKTGLPEEKARFLVRVLRIAGPLTRRQLYNLIDEGKLAKALESNAQVDRTLSQLVDKEELVMHQTPGLPAQYGIRGSNAVPLSGFPRPDTSPVSART